jgi:hypothetical protein
VGLQGLAAGTPGYQASVDVRLLQPGTTTLAASFSTTTDPNGSFSLGGLPVGVYDIEVKEARRVGRIARAMNLVV